MERGAPDLPTGTELTGTPYRIVRWIAGGELDALYEGEHRHLPRRFVIRVVRKESGTGTARDSDVLALLASEHHAYLHDLGVTADGRFYFVVQHFEASLTIRPRHEAALKGSSNETLLAGSWAVRGDEDTVPCATRARRTPPPRARALAGGRRCTPGRGVPPPDRAPAPAARAEATERELASGGRDDLILRRYAPLAMVATNLVIAVVILITSVGRSSDTHVAVPSAPLPSVAAAVQAPAAIRAETPPAPRSGVVPSSDASSSASANGSTADAPARAVVRASPPPGALRTSRAAVSPAEIDFDGNVHSATTSRESAPGAAVSKPVPAGSKTQPERTTGPLPADLVRSM
jgi:hypothetical protein